MAASDELDRTSEAGRVHLRFGWWSLTVFAAAGLSLEALHGFKVGAYLDLSNETRRLMWTLAHAHGALLAIVNIVYGLTLERARGAAGNRLASRALRAASVVLPLGFFLGGLLYYGGDPGLGILLVPVGAVLLLTALVGIARDLGASPPADAGRRDRPPR